MKIDPKLSNTTGEKSIYGWVLAGFILVAAFLLIMEHRAHLGGVLNYLPYLLLAACPVMHIFMHKGHKLHGKELLARIQREKSQ